MNNLAFSVTKESIVKRRQTIIGMFCTKLPPLKLCEDDEQTGNQELQQWIGIHQNKCIYSTCISIMDAAWDIAESQIVNGYEKLDDKKYKKNKYEIINA